MKKQIKFIATATALLAFTQAGHAAVVNWDNGGVGSDWNDVDNWDQTYLPGNNGTTDRALIGAGDAVEVTSAVLGTNTQFDLHVNATNATLAIGADMSNLRRLTGVNGTVTQTAGALQFTDIASNSIIYETGSWTISGGSLGFNGDLINQGMLSVIGNTASVSIGNGTDDNLTLSGAGGLGFTMNAAGISAINVFDTFTVDNATSLLALDLSLFTGTGSFDLVTFTTIAGTEFGAANISGLDSLTGVDRTATIGYDADSMYVTIAAIPEPGTYALLAGLTGLTFVML
ncbi:MULTISPECIES: hypothetical protein, partial [unclassified Lentimonas]